jgi:hypothetical protein
MPMVLVVVVRSGYSLPISACTIMLGTSCPFGAEDLGKGL